MRDKYIILGVARLEKLYRIRRIPTRYVETNETRSVEIILLLLVSDEEQGRSLRDYEEQLVWIFTG